MQRVELAAGRAEAASYDDLRTELTGFTAAMASSGRVEVSHVHLCMEWSSSHVHAAVLIPRNVLLDAEHGPIFQPTCLTHAATTRIVACPFPLR
jgi:hypothetical protein